MAPIEPGKIRNVAVVGHRGTGKTSLVEALLYQTDEINRLGSVDAGSTVSDWDEDEQKRKMSISLTLAHTSWQGRKVNLVDVPGDPSFQGEARCALRVVEGALVVVNAVMGLEVGTARVKHLADELGLARVLFVNMLDRERADFYRTLAQIQDQFSSRCVAVHLPIGACSAWPSHIRTLRAPLPRSVPPCSRATACTTTPARSQTCRSRSGAAPRTPSTTTTERLSRL